MFSPTAIALSLQEEHSKSMSTRPVSSSTTGSSTLYPGHASSQQIQSKPVHKEIRKVIFPGSVVIYGFIPYESDCKDSNTMRIKETATIAGVSLD